MFIGCLVSFIIFGGLAFFISKLALNLGYEKENRFLAILFYFLMPFFSLTLISCLVVGLYSIMGLSVSLAAETMASSMNAGTSGGLLVMGSILTAIFSISAIAVGPASAFTASQFSTVTAIIAVFVSKDEELCKKWLPLVAFACYGFCMWPFTALLSFGL